MELKDFEEYLVKEVKMHHKIRFLYKFPNNFGLLLDIPKDDLLDIECFKGYWDNAKWNKDYDKMPLENIRFIEEESEAAEWLVKIMELPQAQDYYELLEHIVTPDQATPKQYKHAVVNKLRGEEEHYNSIVKALIEKHQDKIDTLKKLIN